MLRVKEICKEKGKSLASVAEEMGITYESLRKLINGNPTLNKMQDIADILGCSVTDLLEEEKDVQQFELKCPKCNEELLITIKRKLDN
jgi:transcriptional regulator with XRE-family HTH domain